MGHLRADEFSGNDNKLAGSIYEQKFIVDAMLRGLYPHVSPADMPCHDAIVMTSTGACVVTQIKSSSIPQPRAKGEQSKRFKILTMCHSKRTKLSDSIVDVLSVYIVPMDIWYHIPAKEINTLGINLHPHIIGSKGRWEGYKDDWSLFEKKF